MLQQMLYLCLLNPGYVEDYLELNFKYVGYQTLAHLSCNSYVCWTSKHATGVQRFLCPNGI